MLIFKISVLTFNVLVTLACSYGVYKTWHRTDGIHAILLTGLAILYFNVLLYATSFCMKI